MVMKPHKGMINATGMFMFLGLFLSGCGSHPGKFSLSVHSPDFPGDTLVLSRMTTSEIVPFDSLVLDKDGRVRRKYVVDVPGFYLLTQRNSLFLSLILHPGEHVLLTGSLAFPATLQIEGSEDSRLLLELNNRLWNSMTQLDSLARIYADSTRGVNNPAYLWQLDSVARQIEKKQRDYNRSFIRKNPGSLASIVALYQVLTMSRPVLDITDDVHYFNLVDSLLYPIYPTVEAVKVLHAEVMKAKDFRQQQHIIDQTVGIGTIPPDIILPSSTGDTVRLSSLLGKVVLLDFWASWCKPCREAHPSMVKTYWRYRARGFEIFQVSLDQDREAWISAIRDDRLSGWLHGSDLKYWNSPAARRYYVSSLPSSFLLDRDGRILAKNLKGEDLEKKLSEIFEH